MTFDPATETDPLAGVRQALAACDYERAEASARVVAADARAAGDVLTTAAALRLAGWSWVERGRVHEATRTLRSALALVQGRKETAEEAARCLHNLGLALVQHQPRKSRARFDSAAALYGPDHPKQWTLRGDRALADMLAGRHAAALAELRPAEERWITVETPEVAARLRSNLVIVTAGAGLRVEAIARLRELRALIESGEACSTWFHVAEAWAIALLGDRERAAVLAGEAKVRAHAAGEVFAFNRAAALLDEVRR